MEQHGRHYIIDTGIGIADKHQQCLTALPAATSEESVEWPNLGKAAS